MLVRLCRLLSRLRLELLRLGRLLRLSLGGFAFGCGLRSRLLCQRKRWLLRLRLVGRFQYGDGLFLNPLALLGLSAHRLIGLSLRLG